MKKDFKVNSGGIIEEISMSVFEFVIQFIPIIILYMIHYFTKISFTNADLYGNCLQIVMVYAAVYLSISKDNRVIDSLIYVIILIISIVLFTLIQVKCIPDIENEMGTSVLKVTAIMLGICFVLRLSDSMQKRV